MDSVNLSTQFNFALESLRQSLAQEQTTALALALVRQAPREQGLDATPDNSSASAPAGHGGRGAVVDILA